jgi:hypothetical protein
VGSYGGVEMTKLNIVPSDFRRRFMHVLLNIFIGSVPSLYLSKPQNARDVSRFHVSLIAFVYFLVYFSMPLGYLVNVVILSGGQKVPKDLLASLRCVRSCELLGVVCLKVGCSMLAAGGAFARLAAAGLVHVPHRDAWARRMSSCR